uniref:Thioredoxin domain-containing protein n=1 Tax=Chlamydomonas leiostraca TaxID=1034604 RepID=A0A7S0WRM6_9CHLO
MGATNRAFSLLMSEYYLANAVVILSYLWFRSKHTGTQVNIKNPVNIHPMFSSLHSSSFDTLEGQIFTTLLITAAFRTFRATSLEAYFASACGFCQLFVLIITAVTDVVVGIQYAMALMIIIMVCNQPTYTGPDQVNALTPITFHEITKKDNTDGITHVVLFYASWSSRCRQTYSLFAELSNRFSADKIQFSKLDIGTWPREAKLQNIDLSAGSAQVPSVIMYEKGHEVARVPSNTKAAIRVATKRAFTKSDLIKGLELEKRHAKATGAAGAASGDKAEGKKKK